MSQPWTAQVRAPGKLYIAGEYAVRMGETPAVANVTTFLPVKSG